MKNKNKISIISAGCIGIGLVLLIIGWGVFGARPGFYFNRTGIHAANENRTDTFHIQEKIKLDAFTQMNIDVRYADLEILPSDGYYIEYRLNGNSANPTLEVENKILRFKEGSWNSVLSLNFFAFDILDQGFEDHFIKLYVPKDVYFSSVKIQSDDGRIKTGDIRAEAMDISNDYGVVEMKSIQGGSLKVDMDSGSLEIENLDVKQSSVHNKYGTSEFGTVAGQSMEAGQYDGDFTIDECVIKNLTVENDYGDVRIGLSRAAENYDYDLLTKYGNIVLPGYPKFSSGDSDSEIYKENNGAENIIKVNSEDGDIIIKECS